MQAKRVQQVAQKKQRTAAGQNMIGTISTTQPNEQGGKTNQGQQQDKKFLSKKERIQKKEEERRARQN